MTRYVFGDSDIAAQRLRFVAEIFDSSTRAFARAWAQPYRRGATVMDLGCALGYTTRLLAEELQGEQTIGIDVSESFIASAQRESDGHVNISYVCHDVTQVPFPMTPVDVLFCRLLLTHMTDPPALIASWATQLRPGGLILMEEVEWIHTNSEVFTAYLDMQRALLEHQKNCLDIGPMLDALPVPSLLRKRASEVRQTPVPAAKVATMFALNFHTWQRHPFVQATFASTQRQQIERDLQALSSETTDQVEIAWGMRQLVYERI
jgi:2-polyprenyl-3-methyl-5-hydroxy-6-metoxy-1,4-benzoquinol methylase